MAAKAKEAKITQVAINGDNTIDSKSKFVLDRRWIPANETYICCPAGLIDKKEINQHCGLLWYYPSGKFKSMKKSYFIKVTLGSKLKTIISHYMKYNFSI